MTGRKIANIYEKFQSELQLNTGIIKKAQKLHFILIEHGTLRSESPYLIASTCILITSNMEKYPKIFNEVSKVSHIKEDDLLKFYKMVNKQIISIFERILRDAMYNSISRTTNNANKVTNDDGC